MSLFSNDKEKKIKSPISFVNPGEHQTSPISYIEKDINGVDKFAILKTTEGGKYMRGNTLYYNLNGVEIYTEATNIIFVDLKNNTVFIREYEKVLKEINPDDPEQRQYILLYSDLTDEDSEEACRWEAVSGRTQAYENIKINAPVIDIDKSLVLVETVAFKDSLTVRQFIDYMKNGGFIKDESFDINDFSGSDYI